ncbi:hypothetical protein FRX31_028245 [Thalictrum thalictroides]|uniref:Uncharacterized protein n=1 Tax=Thalictrum thalictroides TaxID=46969 RepID=A0A7J6VAP7_THATH|nr:hypothetical protein FRX31_028245 [Thalictrum thalictroides]
MDNNLPSPSVFSSSSSDIQSSNECKKAFKNSHNHNMSISQHNSSPSTSSSISKMDNNLPSPSVFSSSSDIQLSNLRDECKKSMKLINQ